MGSPLVGRIPVAGQRKGLQPCNLEIGARDDSLAGDPCSRSLRVRGVVADSSPGPEGKITDAQLVALAVAQAAMGEFSDRKFLGLIAHRLRGWFPHLPDQTQYNRRLRRLVPQLTAVQFAVAELIAEGRVRLADGTLISCANYPGCASHSHFAGAASYGYSPSRRLPRRRRPRRSRTDGSRPLYGQPALMPAASVARRRACDERRSWGSQSPNIRLTVRR